MHTGATGAINCGRIVLIDFLMAINIEHNDCAADSGYFINRHDLLSTASEASHYKYLLSKYIFTAP